MLTIDEIRVNIQPVPQKVTSLAGQPLKLIPTAKFNLTAPTAEKGPVKVAGETITAFLQKHCGEDCIAPEGIPVTLALGDAPAEVKNAREAYELTVSAEGIKITGFGASGLYYGVVSFTQICKWGNQGAQIPAVQVLDWPDNPFRAYKEECRYGSNMMEKEDWFEMIDDLTSKKMNHLCVALYGCWVIQYDGKVAEYLYLPIRNHPELQTPMTVKYYSPTENKWYHYEQLPPMFRDNFFGEVVRYAKDRGMDVIPSINSFGHNTLFPRLIPEIAPKAADGTPQPTGFCTSNPATYEFLFSVYDQIIDEYMLPNDIHIFNIVLDEVWEQYGVHPDSPEVKYSPWCQCEKCRDKENAQLFIEHAITLLKHLKEKGMTSIVIAGDMLVRKVSKLGNLGEPFLKRINEEGLMDVLFFDWWWYHDMKEKLDFVVTPDELGFRSFFCPWNGYYIWSLLTNPMGNCAIMAELNHNAKCGEGLYQYAMWDRSYDRIHDCFSDYAWNYEGTQSVAAVTQRYVQRHFGPMARKAEHAFKLIDWITEERKAVRDPENPAGTILCNFTVLTHQLSYYQHCYYRHPKIPFPRHFPGIVLDLILPFRADYERLMISVASMAKEAAAIFEEAAKNPGCDQAIARRMAYECRNYEVLVEDWMTLLEIYDLTKEGDQKKIAPLARERQNARLALMELCQQTKELWVQQAATMRNHSVFMQMFADIATYIENTENPQLDLADITAITSKELRMIR